MSIRYLLPCQCGKKIPVDRAQAGQTIQCECGADLEVPTLLGLRSLETVEESAATATRSGWGLPQGLTIVGGVVTLGAVAALVFFFIVRPVPPKNFLTPQVVEQNMEGMTLLQAAGLWQQLRGGLGMPLDARDYRNALKTYRIPKRATVRQAYQAATEQYRIRLGVSLVILVAGLAMTVVGLVMCRAAKTNLPADETD